MGNQASQAFVDPSFPLADLPEELVIHVLLFVPAKELLKLRRVCKLFKDIIDTKSLWISKCHHDGVELPPSSFFEEQNLLIPQDFMRFCIKRPFGRNLLSNWNAEGKTTIVACRTTLPTYTVGNGLVNYMLLPL